MAKTRCTATCKDGSPCTNWAVHGTNPPRCSVHGGTKKKIGAPKGNKNALKHGFYAAEPKAVTVADAIAGLVDKLNYIDNILQTRSDDFSNEQIIRMIALYQQGTSRLGRLLRDKRAVSGEAADGISAAIAQALDELSTQLGVKL